MMNFNEHTKQRWEIERGVRNRLLQKADLEINKLEDQGLDASNWRQYRQQLRDVPQQNDNPDQITWPTPPTL